MPMFVGEGEGEGFNINVAWSGAMMGDEEYLAAFHRVLLPVAYEVRVLRSSPLSQSSLCASGGVGFPLYFVSVQTM